MRLLLAALVCLSSLSSTTSFTPGVLPNRSPGSVASLKCQQQQPNEAVVLLVRHGQTEWNVAGRYQGSLDSPLTARGLEQAQQLGERLRRSGRTIDAMWSSDMPRAKRTCTIIADAIGFPVESCREDRDLRERGFGVFEGLDRAEILQRYPDELEGTLKFNLDHKVPGGESRREVLGRVSTKLEQIADENMGRTVMVVSHGACVNVLMRHLLGIPWAPDVKPPGELKIGNTCVCELRYSRDAQGAARWAVHSIGDVAHTEDPSLLVPWQAAPEEPQAMDGAGLDAELRAARARVAALEAAIAAQPARPLPGGAQGSSRAVPGAGSAPAVSPVES